MNIIEYENADGTVDYAPESFLNIGAYRLMINANMDYNVFFNAEESNLGRSPGFCIYPDRTSK